MFSVYAYSARLLLFACFLRVCTADSKSVMHAEHYHFAATTR
jgi:hypothetical protein